MINLNKFYLRTTNWDNFNQYYLVPVEKIKDFDTWMTIPPWKDSYSEHPLTKEFLKYNVENLSSIVFYVHPNDFNPE